MTTITRPVRRETARTCEECSVEFLQTSNVGRRVQRFCSLGCARIASVRLARSTWEANTTGKWRGVERKCARCGAGFLPKWNGQRICGRQCDKTLRFWSNVNKGGEEDCWLYTGVVGANGYGYFNGKLAHRVSYEILNGKIGAGLFACHRCDNPRCVNPGHLFLGSQRDNMLDCAKKNRNHTKLTRQQAEEIRILVNTGGQSQWSIAKQFGISQSTVSLIKQNRYWRTESR